MTGDLIDRIVSGAWSDPATGKPAKLPFRSIVVAPTLDGREFDLIRRLDLGRRLAVVSDPITRQVLGDRVERALAAVGQVNSIALPDRPHADAATVEGIRAASARDDALIAVGSGTINDLCKRASFLDGKPYAVFATAPSMNGYTSTSAAITVDGHKKSLPSHGAAGVFMDLAVLARAPKHMIRSGLGDSLARPTAQTDWLLSHRLLGTPYNDTPFRLLAEDEPRMFAESPALAKGDLQAMEMLARVLLLSGIGMCIAGSSAPASQSEHLVSHYIDMKAEGASRAVLGRDALHGEQIGVTTLTAARLQERLLALANPPRLKPTAVDAAAIRAHFGESGEDCVAESHAKALDRQRTARINEMLAGLWPSLREELARSFVPVARLQAVLARAGAPCKPSDLGWNDEFYRTAVIWARRIRNRYTCLDFIDDSAGLAAWLE